MCSQNQNQIAQKYDIDMTRSARQKKNHSRSEPERCAQDHTPKTDNKVSIA